MSEARCDSACRAAADGCSFQVAWSINPHMRVGAVEPRHAVRQHDLLVDTLRSLGAAVDRVPFVHGAFDCVFAKDNGVLLQRPDGRLDALIAHPRHAERAPEQRARAHAFQRLGARVVASAMMPLEGGDVVMHPGGAGAFLGHGFRSSRSSVATLERFLDREVVPLELRLDGLYHLDMALSMLDDGTALVCEEALNGSSLRALLRHPAVRDIIRVPEIEAMSFGVNMIQIGKTVVWGAHAPHTARALRERGYDVRRVAIDQFHLAGGSAACLVSRVHTQRAEEALELAPESTAA